MTPQTVTFKSAVLGTGYVAAFVTKEASAIVSNHHLELIANNAIWATNDVLHMKSNPSAPWVAVARILQNGRDAFKDAQQ